MKTRPAFLACVTAVCLIASVAQAGVYRMTLKDVAFADGGTASGWFEADTFSDAGVPDNWDITVTGGNESLFPAFDYTPSNSNNQNTDYFSFVISVSVLQGPTLDLVRNLYLAFTPTNAGPPSSGVMQIVPSEPHHGRAAEYAPDAFRYVITGCAVTDSFSGSCPPVISVPEPTVLAGLTLGFLLGAFSVARRRLTRQ